MDRRLASRPSHPPSPLLPSGPPPNTCRPQSRSPLSPSSSINPHHSPPPLPFPSDPTLLTSPVSSQASKLLPPMSPKDEMTEATAPLADAPAAEAHEVKPVVDSPAILVQPIFTHCAQVSSRFAIHHLTPPKAEHIYRHYRVLPPQHRRHHSLLSGHHSPPTLQISPLFPASLLDRHHLSHSLPSLFSIHQSSPIRPTNQHGFSIPLRLAPPSAFASSPASRPRFHPFARIPLDARKLHSPSAAVLSESKSRDDEDISRRTSALVLTEFWCPMGFCKTEVNLMRWLAFAPRQHNQAKLVHYVATLRELLENLVAETTTDGLPRISKAKVNDYSEKIEFIAARLGSPMPSASEVNHTASIEETSQTEEVSSPSGLRRRLHRKLEDKEHDIGEKDTPMPVRLDASSQAHIERHRKLQEDLTDEMVELAQQLKESSFMMNQSLQNTEKILDSTERAVEHSLASTGHANVQAVEVYSEGSKTTCFTWLLIFVMTCIFVMVVLLIRVT